MRLSEVQFGRNQIRVIIYEIVLLDLSSNRNKSKTTHQSLNPIFFPLVILIRSNY